MKLMLLAVFTLFILNPALAALEGCKVGPVFLKKGQRVRSSDGCNTCTCTGSGVACTELACPGNRPPEGCAIGPVEITAGTAILSSDGCNTCTCSAGPNNSFQLSCTELACAGNDEASVNPEIRQFEAIYMKQKETKIPGLVKITNGGCNPKWVGRALGMATTMEVVVDRPGLIFHFDSAENLKAFARSAHLFGSEVKYWSAASNDVQNIFACGTVKR
ncbi:MAG: hypothetical protein EB060_11405 [Proteobacteria bacterium]|nr:hypothetical protein [Pseudomonadota bacterium]